MIMNNWFECKVKSEKMLEGGIQKLIPEVFLVDALNFTEAEARIIKEITPYSNGNLEVVDIKRARYAEMFTSTKESADKWFKVKCVFVSFDEKKQAEKRTAQNMLVQASDLRDAVDNFDNGMKGSMIDYEIAAVQQTSIMDVYMYETPGGNPSQQNDKPEYEQ